MQHIAQIADERDGMVGVHRGFEHFETATHGAQGPLHYARWLATTHPEAVAMFYPVLDHSLEVNAASGGETGAPQVHERFCERQGGASECRREVGAKRRWTDDSRRREAAISGRPRAGLRRERSRRARRAEPSGHRKKEGGGRVDHCVRTR